MFDETFKWELWGKLEEFLTGDLTVDLNHPKGVKGFTDFVDSLTFFIESKATQNKKVYSEKDLQQALIKGRSEGWEQRKKKVGAVYHVGWYGDPVEDWEMKSEENDTGHEHHILCSEKECWHNNITTVSAKYAYSLANNWGNVDVVRVLPNPFYTLEEGKTNDK